MANTDVIPAAAPLPDPAGRRLAERERVWSKLVEPGLAWQPDPSRQTRAAPALTLSAPCEWTVEHLKDAALHVLRVEGALREMGWTLGTIASPWIQFVGCRPVWISQTALRPCAAAGWPGRQKFLDEFLHPLLEKSGGRTLQRRWAASLRRTVAQMTGRAGREDLGELMEVVENLKPRPHWSPWRTRPQALEPPGLAAILAKEEASRRGARLIYEWRGRQAASAPLRPWPCAAWVRFHEREEDAAADYLEMRALQACVLPLWNPNESPAAACPRRPAADLLIATGRGNVPQGAPELTRFAEAIRRMAAAVLVEYAGAEDPGGWREFLAILRGAFRIVQVTETGAGRRVCLLEPE